MQRKLVVPGRAAPSGSDPHDTAKRGVSSGGQPLPYLDKIQAVFGRHDVRSIVAHVGGPAAVAAEQLGALAYAAGEHIAFRAMPDLRTAAHEAAHVVQQRRGVQLANGIGKDGDAYERHADAVADRVVQGTSVEALLDEYAPATAAPATAAPAVQHIKIVGDERWFEVTHIRALVEFINDVDAEWKPPSWWADWQALMARTDPPSVVRRDVALSELVERDLTIDDALATKLGLALDPGHRHHLHGAAFHLVKSAFDNYDQPNGDPANKQRVDDMTATLAHLNDENTRLEIEVARGREGINTEIIHWDRGIVKIGDAIARNIFLKAILSLLGDAPGDPLTAALIAPLRRRKETAARPAAELEHVGVVPDFGINNTDKMEVSGHTLPSAVLLASRVPQCLVATNYYKRDAADAEIAVRVPQFKRLILHEMTHYAQFQRFGDFLPVQNKDQTQLGQIDAAVDELSKRRLQHPDALVGARRAAFDEIVDKYMEHPGNAPRELLSHVIEIRDAWGGTRGDPLLAQQLPKCFALLQRVMGTPVRT